MTTSQDDIFELLVRQLETAGRDARSAKNKEAQALVHGAFRVARRDSDRSAGIVFGSVLDVRLEGCLRRHFAPDEALTSTKNELLSTSGALGTFGARIDLGAMMGIYGVKAWRALRTIKDIRNKFAHQLDVTTFEHEGVRALTDNLTYFDRFTTVTEKETTVTFFPPAGGEGLRRTGWPTDMEPFGTPRDRYTETCVFFDQLLTECVPGHLHPNLADDTEL